MAAKVTATRVCTVVVTRVPGKPFISGLAPADRTFPVAWDSITDDDGVPNALA